MRAKNVIILSSGSGIAAAQRLDELITEIVALKKNPILVLGPDGDDLLRSCSNLEACDLVFDPNFAGDLFSGIKAGLHAAKGAAFVVPVNADYLSPSQWSKLEDWLTEEKSTQVHVLKPVASQNFPQLVTTQGATELLKLPATTPWAEAELNAVSVPEL